MDEEKIRLMTRITMYEQKQDMNDLILSRYYKEDYVKFGCLKTLVVTTICYWLCIAAYILLRFDQFLEELNSMDYFKVIGGLMTGYIIVMVVFYIYAFIVYNYKYSKAKPRLIAYNKMLKKLIRLYEAEEAHEDVLKGRVKVYSEIGGDDNDVRRMN